MINTSWSTDDPGLRLFGFHANIDKAIGINAYGDIAGNVYSAINGRWTFEDSSVIMRHGNVLHYWIYAQADNQNHKRDQQSWIYSRKIAPRERLQLSLKKREVKNENNVCLYRQQQRASKWLTIRTAQRVPRQQMRFQSQVNYCSKTILAFLTRHYGNVILKYR